MEKEEFEIKLKEAGFKNGAEFAKKIGILRASVTEWHKYKYPNYIKCVLDYAIKARNIDLVKEKDDVNAFLKEEIALYKKENLKLKEKIKKLKTSLKLKDEKGFKIIDENYDGKMTKEELDNLIYQMGFKSYEDFSAFLNIHIQTIFVWNKKGNYPKYLKQLLEWFIFLKKYKNNENIEKNAMLQHKNQALKKRLENCILMEKILKEKLKSN